MPVNERGSLPTALFAGFAVSAIGGPLALAAAYLPDAVGGPAVSSMGVTVLAGALLFSAPLLIWWRYSEEVASSGGLYAFVERAAGRRIALVQGTVWTVSYFLYLPFTVTYLVYDQLPESFPAITHHQAAYELGIPIAVSAVMVLAERLAFVLMAIVAAVQVVLTVVLAWVVWHHLGGDASAFGVHDPSSDARGAGNVALLFTCAGLPLFLGGEVAGGGRQVRRTIVWAVVLVAVLLLAVAVPMAALGGSQLAALEVPGYTLVKAYEGDGLAAVIAAGAGASVMAVIVAEYIALTRLMRAMLGVSVRQSARVIAVLFVAGDAISLVNPERAYSYALTPSLVALYVSQAIVYLAYLR